MNRRSSDEQIRWRATAAERPKSISDTVDEFSSLKGRDVEMVDEGGWGKKEEIVEEREEAKKQKVTCWVQVSRPVAWRLDKRSILSRDFGDLAYQLTVS